MLPYASRKLLLVTKEIKTFIQRRCQLLSFGFNSIDGRSMKQSNGVMNTNEENEVLDEELSTQ
jgi:hypothetical protein